MKIKRVKIENFRSLKKTEIFFDNFNIFVGQNNHGKTNFFEAMRWFFEGFKRGEGLDDIRFRGSKSEEIFVEVEFSGAQDGAEKMKHEANKTKIKDILKDSDTVIVKRSSESLVRSIFANKEWIEKLPTGFDRTLNDFLPKFEYIDTKKYFEDVAKFTKTAPIGIMLSGVLTAILEKSEEYQKFHKQFEKVFGSKESDIKIELDKLSSKVRIYLEKQFPDCTKVTFEVAPPIFDDLLKNFDTTIDDGVETPASEKGEGMQRALMLAILQTYADFRKENEDIGKSFLFFIDDAELHLHPTAQRKLKNVLLELAGNDDQVFANTHSSVLIVDEHRLQKIFRVEKVGQKTKILSVKKFKKPYIVYELLGGSPSDLLLPKNFLIVEGKSEFEFLIRVINRHYTDRPQIQIVQASGDLVQVQRSINAIEQIFKPLEKTIYKDKLVILCDKPNNQAALDQFLRDYPKIKENDQIYILPVNRIEEYYPDDDIWEQIRGKIRLAKTVGDNITKEIFESEMTIILDALKKCWDLAYS